MRIVFAIFLVLANAWCVTACTFVPCEPVKAHSDLPPCHQAPDDGEPDTNCAHPVVAFAESSISPASQAMAYEQSPALLPEALSFVPVMVAQATQVLPPGQLPPSPPIQLSVLRI